MSIFWVLCIKKKVIYCLWFHYIFNFSLFSITVRERLFPHLLSVFLWFFLLYLRSLFLAFSVFLCCFPLIYQYCLPIALLVLPYFHPLSFLCPHPWHQPLRSSSASSVISLFLSLSVRSSPSPTLWSPSLLFVVPLLISSSVLHDPPMWSPSYIQIYISLSLFHLNLFFSSHLSTFFFLSQYTSHSPLSSKILCIFAFF